jgi:hypothetical protein
LFSQITVNLKDSILPSTKGYRNNPIKLVFKLTENKKTEKEKFDAIFLWVASNISYDYNNYLSPSGASIQKVNRVLKYKKGICIDYAYLMDTLCSIAGIKNVSVYGYTKDELFDVNDSLYMDNHAWNAVKLDGNWFVYDITWSAGRYAFVYTGIRKKIMNIKDSIISKAKWDTIQRKQRIKTECDTIDFYYFVIKPSLTKKQLRIIKFINYLKLKPRLKFIRPTNFDYYLTNPEVFAINHFPDNPYWSLTASKNIKDFERDSAYYYLDDSIYKKQVRVGRKCPDCDNYFGIDEMNKFKQLKNNSLKFNPRNRFIISSANIDISKLFIQKSLLESDSLTKVSLIDSSLLYLSHAKKDLYQCLLNLKTQTELQKAKNERKTSILFEQNKNYFELSKKRLKSITERTKDMNFFYKMSVIEVRKLKTFKEKYKNTINNIEIKSDNQNKKDKVIKLKSKLKNTRLKIDSVDKLINSKVPEFSPFLESLWNCLQSKYLLQATISYYIEIDGFYREKFLLDNNKLIINEIRDSINKYEKEFENDLDKDILVPSDSCASIGLSIYKLFDVKNQYMSESMKLTKTLVSENAMSLDSLKFYIKYYQEKIQSNKCWIQGYTSSLNKVIVGYEALSALEKRKQVFLKFNNKSEFYRNRVITKEIVRRNRKYRNVPIYNLKLVNKWYSQTVKYKKEYLKLLKAERRKEKRVLKD